MSWTDTIFNFLAKARYFSTQQDNIDGSLVELQANRRGHLYVDPYGGASLWQDTVSAGPERIVKSTSGVVFQLVFHNVGESDVFVFVFDHPTAGVGRPANGGPALFVPVRVNAGQQQGISLARPRHVTSGIYWGASTVAESFTYDASAELLACAEYG